MAVNIPGNTVLGAPYWQRRLARERGGLENQLLEKQVGAFDAREERAERALEIDEGNLKTRIAEHRQKMSEEQRKLVADASAAGLAYYDQNPGDDEGANRVFRQNLPPRSISDDVVVNREVMEAFVNADADEYRQRGRPSDFVGWVNPDDPDDERYVRENSPAADELAEKGWRRIGIVRRQETDEAGAFDPRSSRQKGAAYQKNLDQYNASSDIQEMIGDALPKILDNPESVGIRGKVAIGTAGLLSTLNQDQLAEAAAEAIAGNDVETINAMMTQLQAIGARLRPLLAGDFGAKASETEREIGYKAAGVIERMRGPSDLTKSYPQVIGAMRQLYVEGWANKFRLAAQDAYIDYPFDLSTSLDDSGNPVWANEADVLEFIEESKMAGLDDETILQAIQRLQEIQRRNL